MTMIPFENLPDEARLWSYQSDRKLTATEKTWIEEVLSDFLKEWAAHGAKLDAYGTVLGDYHVLLVVHEEQANASGCSIDSSVHFIKHLEKELGISFFNRLKMLVDASEPYFVSFSELDKLTPDTLVYNNMVMNVGEWKRSGKLPVSAMVPQ
ncbi:hypothetical protein [Fluviicola sp.]|jgi:hypothetical protein|uniref:hypothetical protein n=1 Tax=Fluviicola sp. TaxID=1917219 RepID=UPI00283520A8|nr:hypothetical protein [Fluviicola sp.]MDR0801782.1 hypothetical protein [Fluviicola sp.]